jgi:hypothetical protein
MSGRTSSPSTTITVVAKNTFLSIAIERETCDISNPKPLRMRSKSTETCRSRPGADAHHELAKHSMERLNRVLEMCVPAPNTWEHQMSLEGLGDENCASKALFVQALFNDGKSLCEQNEECHLFRTSSQSSINTVSTMAPGDALENGDSPNNGLQKMLSFSSLDTMLSSDSVECQTPLKGVGSQQQGHESAPRRYNLTSMYDDSCRDAPPTTMMIRNIPRHYSQEYLLMDLHDLGFDGTFDFLHIPTDKATSACVGYAFVNFKDPCWAEQCSHSFKDYRFKRHSRGMSKVAQVSVAHLQGVEKNLQQYQDSAKASKREVQPQLVLFSTTSSANSDA